MDVTWSAIVFIFLAAGTSSGEQGIWDVLQSYPRVEIRDRTVYIYNGRGVCTQPGLQCTSCNRLSLCVATGSGLVEFYSEDCDAELGEYCSVSLKECSGRKSYCSLNAKFKCQDEGVFPDPFDCNQYYICSTSPTGGLTAEKVVCPAGKAFNTKTFQCDLSDNDAICNGYPVPECPETGLASGPLSQNPNLYYVCKGGLPHLFKCLDGDDYVYDPALYTCVQTPQTTTELTTTTEVYEDCIPDKWHHIPHTCRGAYQCRDMPTPRNTRRCGSASYIDPATGSCTVGDCPDPDGWKRACPTKERRLVPKTCNIYYECSSETESIGTCAGYFDRETQTCSLGKCPYTDI